MLILRPSKLDQVGVFTTSKIRKGAKLNLFHPSDWTFIRAPRGKVGEMCEHFGVREGDGYHCPSDWHRMSVGWYLNHSDTPNVGHEDYEFRALRHIRPGEEVTIDYDSL